ncbi:MAG: DMT family transporter [Proteobacteria bacterium]|nr:DMT family transporter [Pseudomonadota bacterium]
MTAGGLAEGNYLGDILALGAMICFAGLIVVMRSGRLRDMTPLLVIGMAMATFAAAISLPSFSISLHDLVVCFVMGAVQSFVAYIMFMVATRHLRAGEISLLGISETIFGPLWVWIAVNEVPAIATFAGAAVILVAVLAQGIATLRAERAAAR